MPGTHTTSTVAESQLAWGMSVLSDRPSELERFEEALRRGRLADCRRIWPRVKIAMLASACEWVPLSLLAHEEKVDWRTLRKRIAGQPFVEHPTKRLCLVERHGYYAWKTEQRRMEG